MFSFRIFIVSSLTFKSFIHFECILVYCVKKRSFFFCIHLSNFPNSIYWIDYLYSIVCSCLLYRILFDHKVMGLFLGSLFCSIGLCVCYYADTRLFWLQWGCSIVWYQVLWYLQLCSSFSRLLWLFRVFFGSIQIFEV